MDKRGIWGESKKKKEGLNKKQVTGVQEGVGREGERPEPKKP